MKRIIAISSTTILIATFCAIIVAAKANFSGTWVLDKAKSEGLPPNLDQVLTVTQDGDKITVQTKTTSDQGEQSISDSYTINGQETEITPRGPRGLTGKGKRTAKWSADGNSFESNEDDTFDTQAGPVSVQIMRKWSLPADGKTLTIEQNVKSPMGEQQFKRTFVKK
jgi:hypothetical protein